MCEAEFLVVLTGERERRALIYETYVAGHIWPPFLSNSEPALRIHRWWNLWSAGKKETVQPKQLNCDTARLRGNSSTVSHSGRMQRGRGPAGCAVALGQDPSLGRQLCSSCSETSFMFFQKSHHTEIKALALSDSLPSFLVLSLHADRAYFGST